MSIPSVVAPAPPGAPATARASLAPHCLERLAGAAVDGSRNFAVSCVFALAFLVCALALGVVATRHAVQPYVLQATPEGAILPAGARLVPYRPGDAERRYFLAQWARHLLGIDDRLSETWLAEAYQLTRGKATVEFTDWLRSAGPMRQLKQDPSLTRAVNVLSVSLVDQELALVRVGCERRSLAHPAAMREKWLLTVHFQAIPPDSEEAILKNPIGLMVTDFQLGEDLEQ